MNGLNVTNFRNVVGSNNPPIEFYQSLDIKTFGLSAEYGRVLGGFTSVVTKAGSNAYKAGALVTWDPGVGGSGSVGHIAYVESVGDDSFVVSEMHAPDLGVVTERRVPIATIADGGVAFIY